MDVVLRLATSDDAEAIAGLVNRAYRPGAGLRGWTHEAELVAGARASGEMVRALLRPGSVVLLLCRGASIVACVHVEAIRSERAAYIGMLATEPAEQAGGLGKRMLACAERYAADELGAKVLRMSVLVARTELMAFYLRRGYLRSGRFEGFPDDGGAGVPRVADLQLETLVKQA